MAYCICKLCKLFSYHRASLPKLIDSISNVHFTSHSGRDVRFDAFGNVPSAYDIYNYVRHPNNESIGDRFNYMFEKVCNLLQYNYNNNIVIIVLCNMLRYCARPLPQLRVNPI